jgi:hypothetical protein
LSTIFFFGGGMPVSISGRSFSAQRRGAHLDKFAYIGLFSGGSIAMSEIKGAAASKKAVKLVFVAYGSRENSAAGKANVDEISKTGIKSVFTNPRRPLTIG